MKRTLKFQQMNTRKSDGILKGIACSKASRSLVLMVGCFIFEGFLAKTLLGGFQSVGVPTPQKKAKNLGLSDTSIKRSNLRQVVNDNNKNKSPRPNLLALGHV